MVYELNGNGIFVDITPVFPKYILMMKNKILMACISIFVTALAFGQQVTLPPVSTTPPAPGAALTPSPLATPGATPTVTASAPPSSPAPSLKKYELQLNYMSFLPEKNGVKILSPKFTYSVDETDDVVLSDTVFNEDTFQVNMGPLKSMAKPKNLKLDPSSSVLFFTAPLALGQKGQIEVLSEAGKILYSKVIQGEYLENGTAMAEALKEDFWKSAKPENQISIILPADELKETLIDTDKKSGFRFCWNQKDDSYYSRFCTPYYRYSKKDQRIKIQTQTSTTKIYVDQKEAPPSGSIDLEVNKPKRFLATSVKGYSLEFYSLVKPLFLSDFYLDETNQWIYLMGHTNSPTFPPTKFFPAIDPHGLISFFHWRPTIGVTKDYWVSVVPKNNPKLTLPGKGGGLFSYPLEITRAPSLKSRIALKTPLKSTYSSKPTLRAAITKGLDVAPAPTAGMIKISSSGDQLSWQFNAAASGEEQTGGLIVKDQGHEFQTYYTLFRGYSGDFSMRLAGVLSADLQLNLLSEVAYNQWFESLFGWENHIISVQRWGISARHFTPLKAFTPKGSTTTQLSLKLTTIDLKYRLSQGLWERDETWGLILGAEDITINNIHGAFGGAGFFWARSMPEIFDSIMNWFPFMSYPKWVDMEMIYYFAHLTSTVTKGTTPTYAVNFHGKILWTKSFFGEAGFGIKAYDYKTETDNVKLQALYGTAGLGLNF